MQCCDLGCSAKTGWEKSEEPSLAASGVHFGEITKIHCMRSAVQSDYQFASSVTAGCLSGGPGPTINTKTNCKNGGVPDNLRKTCPSHLKSRGLGVLDSEWHVLLHRSLFTD